MRVHIIDIDAVSGEETYRATCSLGECYPDITEHGNALAELVRHGRYRDGGGAAPLVLLLDAARHWVGYTLATAVDIDNATAPPPLGSREFVLLPPVTDRGC